MRRSHIWFALAAAWALDFLLAQYHHNRVQAVLTAFFGCCFLGAGWAYRKQEQKIARRKPTP
jgi:hypothetical protein